MTAPLLMNSFNESRKRDKTRGQSTQSAYTVDSKGSVLSLLSAQLILSAMACIGSYMYEYYCKFGNFRKDFIFVNSVKRHICDVKIANRA